MEATLLTDLLHHHVPLVLYLLPADRVVCHVVLQLVLVVVGRLALSDLILLNVGHFGMVLIQGAVSVFLEFGDRLLVES